MKGRCVISIVFAQPEAQAASEGAVANYINAAQAAGRARSQQAFGGGGGGGPSFGGWGAGFAGAGGGGGGGGQQQPDYQAMYDARARAELEVSQGQLNQSEDMQRQRLQAGMATISRLVQEGTLTQDEGRQFQTSLQIPLDALQRRSATAAVQAAEIRNRQQQDQQAQMTAMRSGDAASVAQQFNRFVVTTPDGTEVFINPFTGEMKPLGNRQDRRLQQQQQAQQRLAQQDQHEDDRFRAELDRTERQIRGQRSGDQGTALTNDEKDRLDERMRAAGFHSSDLNEHRNIRTELREDKPLTGPNATPTARQQRQLNLFNGMAQEIQNAAGSGPDAQAWAAQQMGVLQNMEQTYRQNGTLLNLHGSQRQQFDATFRNLAQAVQQRQQPAPAQTPQGLMGSAAELQARRDRMLAGGGGQEGSAMGGSRYQTQIPSEADIERAHQAESAARNRPIEEQIRARSRARDETLAAWDRVRERARREGRPVPDIIYRNGELVPPPEELR